MPEIGQISSATVVRIMPYGAIVRLEEGTVGLVHISEIADCFVEDIHKYCSEGAPVTVRVLRGKRDGRWEFSMKQAAPFAATPQTLENAVGRDEVEAPSAENFGAEQPMFDSAMPHQPAPRPKRSAAERAAFDEKLREFLTDSSERIEDARRHHDHRLHGKRR